jgi:hypothetical protein
MADAQRPPMDIGFFLHLLFLQAQDCRLFFEECFGLGRHAFALRRCAQRHGHGHGVARRLRICRIRLFGHSAPRILVRHYNE